MDTLQLIGSTMGLGFLAGIRLYLTVLLVGLAIRFHWLPTSVNVESLRVLAHPAVLTAAGVACLVEFFADKVPWIDTAWDSFHTFIRPVGAALLAANFAGPIDPALKVTLIVLCGSVAFASHTSKAATRLAVNHSPEPFSNIALSLVGDVFTPVGVWLTFRHPKIVLGAVVIFLGVFVWVMPKIFRSLRRGLRFFGFGPARTE